MLSASIRGFIKYLNNKDAGIPGYVLVDPVKNEADYVKLEKPIQYSSSAYFGKNLQRHVQLSYPTYDFNGYYFELDNEGNPYYICPVLKRNAGLFGAKDVKGIVLCDPCNGDCEYMDLGDIPNWVDRVYDGDLLCDRYNWYGMLSGGFINSKIGNKGCKVTTDDYGYKVMDGDVWVYTGVTSVNGDQSNIGFVLMNSRTAESKYFAIAGYGVLFILTLTNMSNLLLLFIPSFFIFTAFGMLTVLTTVFLANTVDYGELKNNRRDESVIFSMQTFVVKLASGVAALAASICLNLCHLSNDTAETAAAAAASGSSLLGLRMTMAGIPIIGLLIAVLVFRKKFILTEEKVQEITEQIKGKENYR